MSTFDNKHFSTDYLPKIYIPGLVLFSFVYILASDLSNTWLVLILICLVTATAILLSGNIKETLLVSYLATISIDITKAIYVGPEMYYPGVFIKLSDVFLLPLVFLWIYDLKLIRKSKIEWDTPTKIASLYILWMWISGINAELRMAGILTACLSTKYFITYLLIKDYIRTSVQIRHVLTALSVGLVIQAVMIGLQFVTGSPLDIQGAKFASTGTRLVFEYAGAHAFRPFGFSGHPNVMATVMAFLIPLYAAVFFLGPKLINRTVWRVSTIVLVISIVCLVLSLSRGGWVATAAAGIYFVWYGIRSGVVSRRFISAILVGVIAMVIAAVVIYPTVFLRLTQPDSRSTESRVVLMDQAFLIIRRHPLMGVGPGNYNHAAQTNIPASFANLSEYYQKGLKELVVHNKYLVIAGESGLIGLGLFLWMFYSFTRIGSNKNNWSSSRYFALGLGVSAALVGQAVFYLFDDFYAGLRIEMSWLFFGLLIAFYNCQKGSFLLTSKEVARDKS